MTKHFCDICKKEKLSLKRIQADGLFREVCDNCLQDWYGGIADLLMKLQEKHG